MRNVVVTGGSRGLGLAMGETLAAGGYRVIAVARSPGAHFDAAVSRVPAGAGSLEFKACDLSQISKIGDWVRALRQAIGPIYGLVNNAATGTSGLLSNTRDDELQRLIDLNVVSPVLLTKHVARSMMTQREGRIVNIASIVAETGYSGLAAYSASKAAMVGFSRSLARELGMLGITVNAVAPGFIATEMTRELDDAQRAKISARSALRRLAEPVDVARAVEFLLSEAARNITGTVLTVDAGATA